MKKSLSISFLTLMFLSLFNFEARAAVSSWKGIYHGYSQDVSSLMGQYKPSLCSSCNSGYTLNNVVCQKEESGTINGNCPADMTMSADKCCCNF